MSRNTLDDAHIHPAIRSKVGDDRHGIVGEVLAAIARNDVLVVGMATNPFVKRARRALDTNGTAHAYLEYGSYLSQWRKRNVLKMWAGWPTLPMVFVKGVLIGGATDLENLIADGELARMLGRGPGGKGAASQP